MTFKFLRFEYWVYFVSIFVHTTLGAKFMLSQRLSLWDNFHQDYFPALTNSDQMKWTEQLIQSSWATSDESPLSDGSEAAKQQEAMEFVSSNLLFYLRENEMYALEGSKSIYMFKEPHKF